MAKIDINKLKKQTIDIAQAIKSFVLVLFDHLKNGVDFVITKIDTKKSLSAAKKATLVSFLSYSIVLAGGYHVIKKFDIFGSRSYSSGQAVSANAVENNETYEAIFSCGMGTNDHINILACFAGGRNGADTELELNNGNQYGMYKAYNISGLGREFRDGFHIKLHHNFSIKAQNSHDILTLSLKIKDSQGNVVFQKSVAQYGVISVTN
jgi:hypothetical protein